MVYIYVRWIKAQAFTLEEVPLRWRAAVAAALDANNGA